MFLPNGLKCDGYSSVEYLYEHLPETAREFLEPMKDNNGKTRLYPCYLKRLPIEELNIHEGFVVRIMGRNGTPIFPIVTKSGDTKWYTAVTLNVPIDFDLNSLYEHKE